MNFIKLLNQIYCLSLQHICGINMFMDTVNLISIPLNMVYNYIMEYTFTWVSEAFEKRGKKGVT